jgi:DNA-binding response OmpR family regulator
MSQAPAHRGRVLLLEDEALIAVTLQDDLEEVGYGVVGPFTTCRDALSWLARNKPDLAILDSVLKDGPCQNVALALTSLNVPFLVYSGYAQDLSVLRELTNATWVEKPATAEVLLQALAGLRSGARSYAKVFA